MAVREQDRVEGEPLQAAAVHLGDRQPVAGDADEPDEPFLPRLDGGSQRTVLAQRQLPFGRVDEAVQLDQIDVIDSHPFERAANLLAGRCVRPLAGLGREEETVTVLAKPGREPELRLAVARRGVDVIDPVLEQELERVVGLVLRHVPERRGAEDHA